MTFTSLNCPQCGAPLPRQARWRMVACPHCSAMVTKSASVVEAATFHDAWARSRETPDHGAHVVRLADQRYRLLAGIGAGAASEVFLAERIAALPERVTLKLANANANADADADADTGALVREAGILARLQAIDRSASAYFSQRLPQPIAHGNAEDGTGRRRAALLLRHPAGYWGSLDAARRNHPGGIDARHVVWIWRRVLDVLGYIHDAGWSHGDVHPEHLLVHPRDHGVLLIGWSAAQAGSDPAARWRDLRQSAWAMRLLLAGIGDDSEPAIPPTVPSPLAALLSATSEDSGASVQDAASLGQAVSNAARAAFGAPRFIDFDPQPHT